MQEKQDLTREEILQLFNQVCKSIEKEATLVKDEGGIELNQNNINARIKEMAKLFIQMGDEDPLFVIPADGALPFAFAFLRELSALDFPFQFTAVQVSSYEGTKSSELKIKSDLKISPEGRKVFILEDLVDTGNTVLGLTQKLKDCGAISVETIALIDKKVLRSSAADPKLSGFRISGEDYIIGYGMDFIHRFRDKEGIWKLKESTIPTQQQTELFKTLNETPKWKLTKLPTVENQRIKQLPETKSQTLTPSKTKSSYNKLQILSGLLALSGIIALVVAFTILNAATGGIAGLVTAAIGTTAFVAGLISAGVFAAKMKEPVIPQSIANVPSIGIS